jgi:hypothetical protein
VVISVQKSVILMAEAKYLIVYWPSKGHNARTTHRKLIARFNKNAPTYSSDANWFRRFHLGEDILDLGIRPLRPLDGLIDFKIPFHSVHAWTLNIPRSAI